MQKTITAVLAALFILSLGSCQTVQDLVKPKKDPVYKFTDDPYDTLGVEEKKLYNYVFALTKNRLKYYVENTYSAYPDLLGLVLEVKVKGHQTIFKNIIESPVIRGWQIYDEDIIGISDNDLAELNRGSSPSCEVCKFPKVRYNIQVKGDLAQVYVSYWIQQYKTYNFIYYIKRQGKDWTITDSIEK